MPVLCSHEGGGAWPGGVGGCIPPGPLGGGSLFGGGVPYGNISGVASYDASSGTWTVFGAATVDITLEALTAVLMCRRLIVTSTGVLTVATNCKGLLIFASVFVEVQAGGKIHADKKGKAGNFGDLTPYDLIPTIVRRALSRAKLMPYVVQGEGAAGALPKSYYGSAVGNTGSPAAAMQTGGGGGGGVYTDYAYASAGRGGKGGPCCGGAGSGGVRSINGTGTADAGDYGGPGSDGRYLYGDFGGGAGDPVGGGTVSGTGPGGGLLIIVSPLISVASGGVVSTAGADGGGGGTTLVGGGGGGGGCVVLVTNPGGYTNNGTVSAPGGLGGVGINASGGPGGAGSVNIFQAA